MKIFFGVSLRAAKKFKVHYAKIFDLIHKLGHINLNELPVIENPDSFYTMNESEIKQTHIRLSLKIKQADVIIIETTTHSLTMGYYVKMALDLDKPVIILYQKNSKPYYFSGIENDKLQLVEYSLDNLKDVLSFALNYAKENLDIRFNLFIASELNEYLKWAAGKQHMARSNFVRNLIIEHKKEHIKEYEDDLKK